VDQEATGAGSIAIHVGTQTYEVDFRGHEKSRHVHSVVLQFIAGH